MAPWLTGVALLEHPETIASAVTISINPPLRTLPPFLAT
jgi:hypothetical protein